MVAEGSSSKRAPPPAPLSEPLAPLPCFCDARQGHAWMRDACVWGAAFADEILQLDTLRVDGGGSSASTGDASAPAAATAPASSVGSIAGSQGSSTSKFESLIGISVAPPPTANQVRIRAATARDIGTVMRFVHELADFEKAPDDVATTARGLRLLAAARGLGGEGRGQADQTTTAPPSSSSSSSSSAAAVSSSSTVSAGISGGPSDPDVDFMLPGDEEDSDQGIAFSSSQFHVMICEELELSAGGSGTTSDGQAPVDGSLESTAAGDDEEQEPSAKRARIDPGSPAEEGAGGGAGEGD